MRAYTKVGDIFRVPLENGIVRYVHYIAKDSSELHSDVLRIYKHQYHMDDRPAIDSILRDKIECHLHTFVRYGVKWGLWYKYGSSIINDREISSIVFRESLDYGKYPKQTIVSKQWVVWRINGPRLFVGELPKQYYSSDVGGVYAPEHIIYRLKTGEMPDKYYPLY